MNEESWLVEPLWMRSAVGFIGGVPKLGKTWMGLDLALSVATGTPCLGRYPVAEPGRALVYLAEDHPSVVRQRLEGLCRVRNLDITQVPVDVITAPSLRLDLERDQKRLADTVHNLSPKLVLLDPLIRLHRVDENSSGDVSGLLAYLRDLQRTYDVAIIVVHHMRKSGGPSGQSLRGSGDFHAWTDSALYLQRLREQVILRAEHRSAPSPDPIELQLVCDHEGQDAHLEVMSTDEDSNQPAKTVLPLSERILDVLTHATTPITRTALRQKLRINNQRLGDTLTKLHAQQRIDRTVEGWIARHSENIVLQNPSHGQNGTRKRPP
jgi:hypothetical protein